MRLTVLAILVATLAGLLSGQGLPFELLCHFRVQYLLVAIVVAVVLAHFCMRSGRHWGWLWLTLATIVVNGAMVVPWYLSADRPLVDHNAPVTLVQSNLYSGNRDLSDFLSLVDAETPDLVAVQELNKAGESRLKELSGRLPHAFTVPREDNFGIGIYSKWPIVDRQSLRFGEMALPTIGARIDVDGQMVNVIVVHPPPPVAGSLYRERNRYLQELSEYVAGLDGPVVVAGDLNSSMWSDHYQPLEAEGGLFNTRVGFGVLPSWPADFPFLGIPLDHCMVSQEVAVIDLRLGPDIGSDHLPLIARLGFAIPNIERSPGGYGTSVSR